MNFSPLNLSGLFLAVFVVMMFVMGVAAQTILLRDWIFEKENAWWKEGKGKINHDIDDEQKN